jgi:hypothetical protein
MRGMRLLVLLAFACSSSSEPSSDPRPPSSDPTPAEPTAETAMAEPAPDPAPAEPPVEPSEPAPPARASGEPSRFEVYRAFLSAVQVPLSDGEACDGVVGIELSYPPTLGDWLAYNLAVLSESEEGPAELPVACHAAEGHDGEWECTMEFATGAGGDSPWKWGVRARIRDADATFVDGSFTCVGAG